MYQVINNMKRAALMQLQLLLQTSSLDVCRVKRQGRVAVVVCLFGCAAWNQIKIVAKNLTYQFLYNLRYT